MTHIWPFLVVVHRHRDIYFHIFAYNTSKWLCMHSSHTLRDYYHLTITTINPSFVKLALSAFWQLQAWQFYYENYMCNSVLIYIFMLQSLKFRQTYGDMTFTFKKIVCTGDHNWAIQTYNIGKSSLAFNRESLVISHQSLVTSHLRHLS